MFLKYINKKTKKSILIIKKTNNKNRKNERKNAIMMKFVKGVMLGTLVSAGMVWMYNESSNKDKKKLMKKGKRFLKNMGI